MEVLQDIVTWLKQWFYDEDEIDTKVAGLQSQINNKASQSDLNTLSSTVSNKVDKVAGKGLSTEDFTTAEKNKLNTLDAADVNFNNSYSQSITDVDSALLDLDTRITGLSGIKAIEIVSVLPTASADTMGKLYIIEENLKVNVYYTERIGGNYTWHKMDTDILDDLSINWSDILNNPFNNSTPSSFANATHTHNTGQITDPNGHTTIGTAINATQTKINTAINTEFSNINNSLAERKVFYIPYDELPQGQSDWGYEEMYFVNYNNEWRLYYWKEITTPYLHYDFEYVTLSKKGDSITSIELVPKTDDSTGAIRLYYGDES